MPRVLSNLVEVVGATVCTTVAYELKLTSGEWTFSHSHFLLWKFRSVCSKENSQGGHATEDSLSWR